MRFEKLILLISAVIMTSAACNNGSLLDATECFTEENDLFKAHEGHAHDDEEGEDDEDGETSASENEEEPMQPSPCDPES